MARQNWPEFKKKSSITARATEVLDALHALGIPAMCAWALKGNSIRLGLRGRETPYVILLDRFDINLMHTRITGPCPPKTLAEAADMLVLHGRKTKVYKNRESEPFWIAPLPVMSNETITEEEP